MHQGVEAVVVQQIRGYALQLEEERLGVVTLGDHSILPGELAVTYLYILPQKAPRCQCLCAFYAIVNVPAQPSEGWIFKRRPGSLALAS